MKQGQIIKSTETALTQDALDRINTYTRRTMTEKEIYTFSVVLCDNDIDRDFECFDEEALHTLKGLFTGKTGVFDHNPKAENQTARIYDCCVEQVQGQKTQTGKPYMRLVGKAYLPRSEKNEDFILSLDSGIQKEVSVGCAVSGHICSVCGKDMRECTHKKGETYDGSLCYATLCGVTDAYEWSFVAVPAQRQAGVIKSYKTESAEKYEKALRGILGVEESEELGNLDERLGAYKAQAESKLALADKKLITAEINGLQGYDHKLLTKVLDLTAVKVDDKGTVTGLQEAVAAAEKEYPAVKLPDGAKPSYVPYNPAGAQPGEAKTMNDLIRGRKN